MTAIYYKIVSYNYIKVGNIDQKLFFSVNK